MLKYLRFGWLPVAGAVLALALGTVALAVPLAKHAAKTRSRDNARAPIGASGVTAHPASRKSDAAKGPAKTTTPPATRTAPATGTAAASVATAAPAQVTTTPPDARAASTPRPSRPSKPSIDAYRGLGTWVDLYDERAFADPAAAVNDMAARGVKTLFIETSNSSMSSAVMNQAKLGTFIRTAHARGMRVVAWYLPDLTSVRRDKDRVAQAIRFRTTDGQGFDSFAMDIESTKVGNVGARNRALQELSTATSRVAGPSYPLGAIIPSPLDIKNGFWGDPFPYQDIARTYDVFVPMSYYTFRTKGGANWYSRTLADVRTLRAQPGLSNVPIHFIGGLSEKSTPSEVRAMVRGIRDSGLIGGSLYEWGRTTPAHWQQLKVLAQ